MNSRKSREKKHKLIRKGKESTVIEFNLSKAVILLIIIGVIIAGIITKEIVTTIIEAKQTELLANEEQIDVQDIKEVNGDLGYITSAEASEVKTGVGPFDENDDPGNDSSEENNIVRSFDQLTWTYELTFGLKPGTTETSLKGGVIEVEAKLPESLTNLVEWDLGSMLWIEDANLSSDGMNLTGNYIMSDDEITIPGKTNVVFVLQVKNATQGTEIQPLFKFKLSGNEKNEEVTQTAEKVIVSSTGKYNIQLHSNTGNLSNKTTLNYGQGEISGRMYGYGFTVQLYNDNESKGLKGLEYPEGEISFDIDLKLERTEIGSTNDYDIYTANKFMKIDGNAFEPIYYDDGSKYKTSSMNGNAQFKVWYVTKKDGTNWTSQEEMNNGNIENMDIYETIEEIPEDKICVGIYFETISGYIARSSGSNNVLQFLLKIKETAEIGKTYAITQRTWYWIEQLDRSIYTIENPNVEWPETEWDSGNLNYIKTEYDENGQMVIGTHSGGDTYGNTVLIVGANLHGNIRAIDSNKADKVNYDLGKNEDIVTYSIEPALDANENIASQIEDVVIKAEVTLPKGLEYVPGSSKRVEENYTEPKLKIE